MHFVNSGGRRIGRSLAVAVAILALNLAHAQVSLSVIAKAVAASGSGASSTTSQDAGSDDGSGVESPAQTFPSPNPGSGPATPGKPQSGFATTLEHGGLTSTSPVGASKLNVPGQGPAGDASDMSQLQAGPSSSSSGANFGSDVGAEEKLSSRRELAIGIAGAGGLFLFGIGISTYVTRNRRMAMRYHE